MPKYFQYFPTVKHTNQLLVDITKRAKFVRTLASDPRAYLPYTIKGDETADEISYYYYGTVDYVWMVYLANNIIDPYKDWPMTDRNLNAYIADKYKEEYMESMGVSTYTDQDVINWTQRTDIEDNILYWRAEEDDTVQLSPESYENASIFDPQLIGEYSWYRLRIYDAEVEANENKRIIRLINADYADQIAKEFKRLMNE
jgi:hypothetical protein